jgi:hypothetical protein
MEFIHASIALLSSMILILAGMVGWLYWQQTRLFQNMNNIVMVIGELARPPVPDVHTIEVPILVNPPTEPEPETEVEAEVEPEPEAEVEDDRVTVVEEVDVVEGAPAPIDTDGLEDKSVKELKDMLTKRGIPFGKRDSKNILITLLKATA